MTTTVIRNVAVATTARCLNLLMIFLPFSLISSSVLARVPLLDGRGEDECSGEADDPGDDKRYLRRELPEESPDCSRGRDRDAAHEVVKPDGARPQVCTGEVHDHRLARRLTYLAQAPDDESNDQ